MSVCAGHEKGQPMENDPTFYWKSSHIQIVGPETDLNFLDSQSVTLTQPVMALEAWRQVMRQPMPVVKRAFAIRDAVVSKFGVKRIGGFSGTTPAQVEVGQKLDFFLVEHISPQVLTLTERDTHLDVMTCISVQDRTVSITSSVITHNWVGRLYMVPVGPAHKMIVARNLLWLSQQMR